MQAGLVRKRLFSDVAKKLIELNLDCLDWRATETLLEYWRKQSQFPDGPFRNLESINPSIDECYRVR